MKTLRKILIWNDDYTTSENVLLILYRTMTYLVPSGLLLWNLVIDKLINKEVSIWTKIGCGGLFLIIALLLVGVIYLGRHFRKTIEQINDKLLDCTDPEKKEELLAKKKKVKKWQETYRNACLLAPFIIALVLVNLIETGIITLRGTLTFIVLSMSAGFGFNITAQSLISKNK